MKTIDLHNGQLHLEPENDIDQSTLRELESRGLLVGCGMDPENTGRFIHAQIRESITAGLGDDREHGKLDGFENGMAIVRWNQGTVTPCPISELNLVS